MTLEIRNNSQLKAKRNKKLSGNFCWQQYVFEIQMVALAIYNIGQHKFLICCNILHVYIPKLFHEMNIL